MEVIGEINVEKLNKVFEENVKRFADLEDELGNLEELLLWGKSGDDGDGESSDNVDDSDNNNVFAG